LPDGKRVYRPLVPRNHGQGGRVYYGDPGPEYVVPDHPLPEQHFYNDCEPGYGQEFAPELATPGRNVEQLPMPAANNHSLEGTEIISDQP
jgi:hypothetical protein